MSVCYLDNANGFPGQVEAGVEQEGEAEGESSVPAETRHKRAALRTERPENKSKQTLNLWTETSMFRLRWLGWSFSHINTKLWVEIRCFTQENLEKLLHNFWKSLSLPTRYYLTKISSNWHNPQQTADCIWQYLCDINRYTKACGCFSWFFCLLCNKQIHKSHVITSQNHSDVLYTSDDWEKSCEIFKHTREKLFNTWLRSNETWRLS